MKNRLPVFFIPFFREKMRMKSINKIVITGGPCAGKTMALGRIGEHFTELGYKVIFIPETATELISSGIAPWTCRTNYDYQLCQMKMQIEKERIFEEAADSMDAEKILIVCDRGLTDNTVYMQEEDLERILSQTGENRVSLRDRYDAVFHLVTAAKGAEKYYSSENNPARRESPEQAVMTDNKLISAWTGHPHLRIIDNSGSFEDKLKRLIDEIEFFLGEPEPLEIERKYLIEYPDIRLLSSLDTCRKVEIVQSYITNKNGQQVRLRRRGENGNYIYFETFKQSITGTKRIETERRLTKEEYITQMDEAENKKRYIIKDRYCLVYKAHYFEIDVYPFWNDKAVAEIELKSEDEYFEFPDYIKIIREVSDDPSYRNFALARETEGSFF